jgi:Carbohydrate esterase, sialic acid-specific acetylesterase
MTACGPSEELAPRAQSRPQNKVQCTDSLSGDVLVVIIIGQSNAANHGEAPTSPRRSVFALHKGQCYAAADPQPGASGTGGSPWPALGDRLIETGLAKKVLLVNCAITSTTIAMWNENPALLGCVTASMAELSALQLAPGLVLFHQGEADARANTSSRDYLRSIQETVVKLKKITRQTPILVAQATICRNEPNMSVRQAQAASWDVTQGIYPGPDTDKFGVLERYDGCHFSKGSLAKVAEIWHEAIKKTGRFNEH